jgi:hypothetical protein
LSGDVNEIIEKQDRKISAYQYLDRQLNIKRMQCPPKHHPLNSHSDCYRYRDGSSLENIGGLPGR